MPRHHAKHANIAGVRRDVRRDRHRTYDGLSPRAKDRLERRAARMQIGKRVAFVHELRDRQYDGPKQPGRRFGPPPKADLVPAIASAPAPMDHLRRVGVYVRQTHKFTPAQRRRLKHKFGRHHMNTGVDSAA